MTITCILASVALAATAFPGPPEGDADGEPRAELDKPQIKELGDGKFEAGLVRFNSKTREISFPCTVNMTEGLLEYAIVHENGKIHESLLSTKIRPLNLNVALKLLRFKPSPELFEMMDEDFRPNGLFPDVPEEIRAAVRVEILLSWKDAGGKEHEAALNDWITNEQTNSPVPAAAWVYGGSYLHNGVFQAQAMGDVAAIYTNQAALFNFPGKDRGNDEVWVPTPERVPPVGTPVTVTIKPPLKR